MQLQSSVFFLSALLLLILPLDWIASVVAAAVFHELCHVAVLYTLGGKILHIKMHAWGCVIETSRVGNWRQFFSILAGPLGSFGLLLFCRTVPKIAVCGLFQGLFNLIPVLPLDGGRLLRLLLYSFCPNRTERVMDFLAVGICILLGALVIWLGITGAEAFWPFLIVLVWMIKVLPRKFPCKPLQNGVQ